MLFLGFSFILNTVFFTSVAHSFCGYKRAGVRTNIFSQCFRYICWGFCFLLLIHWWVTAQRTVMQSVSPRQLESNDLNVCYIVVTDASLHFYYDSYTGFDEPCMFAGEVKNPKVSLQYCNSQRSITTLLLLFGGILLTSSILLFLA